MKKRALPLLEGRVMRLCAVFALLLRFALVGDGGLRGGYRFGVAEVVVLDGLELVVELVDERHAGGDCRARRLLCACRRGCRAL